MRLRLLVSVAALAAALLPATAHAATISVTSAPYAATVELSWVDITATTAETVYRAPGPCDLLPMPGAIPLVTFTGNPPIDTSTTDAPGEGGFCYYLQDDLVGAYSNAVDAAVDTVAPAVSMLAPAGSSTVHGASVGVSASASDGGSGVTGVVFWAQLGAGTPVQIGSDSSGSPYTDTWDTTVGFADGLYSVWAVATDAATLTTTATAVANVRVDNTPPAVSMLTPATSSTVHGASVGVSASASDGGSGVTGVAFWARLGAGTPVQIGSDSSGSPYDMVWDTTAGFADGLYSVWAVATDGATLETTGSAVSSVRVDNTAPAVAVLAPAASSTVHGASAGLSASGTDSGSGVTGVTFWAQLGAGTPVQIGSDTTGSPYTDTWDTTVGFADGLYSLWAVATDGATLATTSTVVTSVRVDNTAPVVSMLTPAVSASVGGSTVGVSANATDAGGSGVTGVVFWAQRGAGAPVQIGSDSSGNPYDIAWDTTAGFTDGLYSVWAVATDGATLPTTSASVTSVLVDNHAPPVPSTPTGLTSVSAAPTITFNAVTDPTFGGVHSDVDYYDVYRNGVKMNASPIDETGAPSYSWSDAGLASNSPPTGPASYAYTVKAVDKAGNTSGPSGALSIFLDPSAVSAPTSVASLATPTNQRPQVSWAAPATPGFTLHHYKVYRGGAFLFDVAGTSFTDTSTSLPDGAYVYQIVAADSGDLTLGIASAPVAVVYDATAPAAPGGVGASAVLDGSVGIGWAAASDGTGSGIARYVVRRSLSSTPPATASDGDATCQGTGLSCVDATTLTGKLYSYSVFAVDRAGNTSPAGVSLGVTARDQLAPAVPTGLAATPADASVDLRWTAAAADDDVAGYVLVARPGTAPPSSDTDGIRVCTAIVAASTTCSVAGLTNGATYTFGLFALDEALNRSQAAVVSAAPNGRVTDVKAPAAVTRLSAKISGRTVTLTWKNPGDRDFDHVVVTASERKPSARAAAKRVYSGKGTKATIKLAAGQARWFAVVAYDAVGNASAREDVRAAVKAPSRFGPAPRAKVHGKVRLSWPLVKGAKYYNVQIYSGKTRVLVSWPAGRALQLPRAKLKRGKTYTWYVWPGLGAKAKAHYGKLIGKNVFTFTG